jgi:phosphate transport system protein
MPHYEQRLSEDLQRIRAAIRNVAEQVSRALERSVKAMRVNDRDMLYEVALDDFEVNREIREIDALCHAFVARHLPAAGHLRFISSVLRLTIAIERAGDYAVTISRVVLQLEKPLGEEISEKIISLAELSGMMLDQAVAAFLDGNVELALSTKRTGKRVDRSYDEVFHALIDEQPRRPSMELASLLTIFGKIERFSDQAKNICDEAVFAATGKVKAPRVFRVLFLDEKNTLLSTMASAIAWKSFPEAGVYSSAGTSPGESRDDRLEVVGARYGLDFSRARRPTKLEELAEYPTEYHVVVALGLPVEDVPHIPYHTILQHWDDLDDPTGASAEEFDEKVERVVRQLSHNIRELIERLRGEQDT